ncbi:MAG: arginyltransferase [Myxococcales bacterium]|nr:arginyltransferase [Myxococcales bacterium]
MSAPQRYPMLPGNPPELLVYDEPMECPYLPEQTARLPLRLPLARLSRSQLDERLAQGERRQGRLVYRTACPQCEACEGIRIPVRDFTLSRSQKRVFRRGQREIETEMGPVLTDAERVALYNKHKRLRGLDVRDEPITAAGYAAVLADTCSESFELRYRVDGKLVGIAITDRSEDALSAVYCYYDPDFAHLSPGVYSVLHQLWLCRRWGLSHLYLGLTISQCKPMVYKRKYLPHERLLDGRWTRFDRT